MHGFNREMLEEVTDQLRPEFTQNREANDKRRDEPTVPGRFQSEPGTEGHRPQPAAVPEERTHLAAALAEERKDPHGQEGDDGSERKDSSSQGGDAVSQQEEEEQVFKEEEKVFKADHQNMHPQTETSTTGEEEEGVTGVMPHLEGLSPTAPKKARSEIVHDDSSNLVFGTPDLVPARPPRRACSKVFVPAQPRQPKAPK